MIELIWEGKYGYHEHPESMTKNLLAHWLIGPLGNWLVQLGSLENWLIV